MTKGKKIRVHVSTMGCAGITVDRSRCRDLTECHDSPPPPSEVRVVAVLSRNGTILGVTPLSSALRQAPTRGEVSQTSNHRYVALWTESKIPSTITFDIDFPNQLTSSEKQVRSAACSRLMTKDFEMYLGVAWDDNKPIPFAAANLSLKPGMQSKAYDLPLYPIREVQLETFQPPKPVSQEEKKDDATTVDQTAQCYGIDNLDALLRVHITIDENHLFEPIDELIEPADEVEVVFPLVLNRSIRKEGPEGCWAAALSATSEKHEAAPKDHEVTDQSIGSSPLTRPQKRIAIDPIDENSDYVKSCPNELQEKCFTSYAPKSGLQRNDDDKALYENDSDSLRTDSDEIEAGEDTKDEGTASDVCSDDDNTADSADDTLLSQESFPALRMHIRKVERFVEGIALPECRTFDRKVKPSFDEDESTVNQRDSQGNGYNTHTLKNMFARSQCGAITDIRTWLQSRDVDYEGNRDDFMSILSQTTRGTATTFAEPVLPLTKVGHCAASDSVLTRSGADGMYVPTKSVSTEEADESTLDGTLNSFPIDERSYQKDNEVSDGLPPDTVDESSLPSIIGSTDSAIPFGRHRDPSCATLNFFQCDDNKSERRTQAGLLKTSVDRSRLVCSDLQMPDDVLSQFVPQTSAAESASGRVSQQHVDRFPGMLEGKLKNLFRLRKTQPMKNANQVVPPLQLLKTFPDPDGDYLSVGDLTLTTHERRLESESGAPHPDSDLVLLKNRSKKFLPAPSATISSFYAFTNTSSADQHGDFPFDEADPFMQDPGRVALAPDMSAAVGLAWARQRAEQANRRQPGKGL